jgi:two-component system phosphate regulon response regulator PhoB
MSDMAESISSAQILVVEDEAEIRELISLLLLRQGHRVQQCGSAIEALDWLKKTDYDLVVLDWMLPQLSGIELLKHLSENGLKKNCPVLMVTAKAEPTDIVQGLEAGADDYITKPFEPSVFAARVRALLRRQSPQGTTDRLEVLSAGGLTVDLKTYQVKAMNEVIHLTPSEFKILSAMLEEQGRVMTRDRLIEIVQGEGINVTGRTIDTHVFGLRKKLGPCSEVIETIRGVGYRVKGDS